jgi:hypothetical protein
LRDSSFALFKLRFSRHLLFLKFPQPFRHSVFIYFGCQQSIYCTVHSCFCCPLKCACSSSCFSVWPLNDAQRLEFRQIYIAIFVKKRYCTLHPPPPPPLSLSKILIFDADLKKTDGQARAAVNNLFKKGAQAVRDCV